MQLVDYKQIPPLPRRQVVLLVNNFIVSTGQFLNRFSTLCEEKLTNISSNIERLETTMNILEAKLASIPGLESGAAPSQAQSSSSSDSSIPPPPPPPPSFGNVEEVQSEEPPQSNGPVAPPGNTQYL